MPPIRADRLPGPLETHPYRPIPHGQWLPWVTEHCKLSERSVQLYMQVARNRDAIEARFADGDDDLSLNEAAGLMMLTADVKKALEWARKVQTTDDPEKVIALCIEYGFTVFQTPNYDPFADFAEADRIDWHLFRWFLIVNENAAVDGGVCEHVDWILRHDFKTVEEWLGPEGDKFRWWSQPQPEGFKKRWRAFRAKHAAMTVPEIEAEVTKIADYQRAHPQPKRGRR
jgi:hypothetical protein